jgi:hypothetical protein
MGTTSLSAPTQAEIANVASRRIYFGHQSVGGNILDGVKAVAGGALSIVESREAEALAKPAIAHVLVGKNEAPLTKLVDFEQAMERIGDGAEIALLKFCYVDFDPSTDVPGLFSKYRDLLTRLRARYPKTIFVHVTTPLTTTQTGIKAWLKHLMGRPAGGEIENAQRERFNSLLRSNYATEPIFDLARIEATRSDGSMQSFTLEGTVVPSLAPEHTGDGGHLNAAAQRLVGSSLIQFLAALPPSAK